MKKKRDRDDPFLREDHPYDHGYWAAYDGKKLRDCPYRPGTPERAEWEAGWRELRRELREESRRGGSG